MLLCSAPVLHAQTAAEIDALLKTPEVSVSQAAYFVLAAAYQPGQEEPPAGGEAAFQAARARGWLPAKAESADPITLGGLSFLMMKAFDLKGGLMYRLLGNPRYAYREMTGQGFIEGRAYPSLRVSGRRFLQITGNILAGRDEK
jgi:hypothetical protein